MRKILTLFPLISLTALAVCVFAFAQDPAAPANINLAGTWALSWQARIGPEKAIIQLRQNGDELRGLVQSRFGSPTLTGSVHGNEISFDIPFAGRRPQDHSFTLSFTGTVERDKMSGNFAVQGMQDGYDWHGENAHNTDYSWTATRERPAPNPRTLAATQPAK